MGTPSIVVKCTGVCGDRMRAAKHFDRVEKLKIFGYGQLIGKNTDKGYRAHTMLETSNTLQREPQPADLNMRRELISCPPCPVFIFRMGEYGFIIR